MKSLPMSAQAIFAAMLAIVERPGYPYLQAYKDDLYKIDKETILNEFSPGSVYVWMVNPNGTHLTRIGVHAKQNEWAKATIESGLRSTELGAEIYLITDTGVCKITELQAQTELAKWHYAVANNTVRDAKGQLIAVFELRQHCKPGDGNQYTDVMFQSSRLQFLTKSDLLALRDIGTSETVMSCHSFFAKTETLTINGLPLSDLVNKTQETEDADAVCA